MNHIQGNKANLWKHLENGAQDIENIAKEGIFGQQYVGITVLYCLRLGHEKQCGKQEHWNKMEFQQQA